MGEKSEDDRFGPFVLDRRREMLLRNGEVLPLGRRAYLLLEALYAADGQTIGKSTLIDHAWQGAIVEEGNLTVQIAALRKLLGTRDDGHDWVATVPRVGYRLIRGPAVDLGPVSLPLLAVLPFRNLGADPEQDYFADGIVEELTSALSRFRSFAVIARNSAFSFKGHAMDVRDVANRLSADYVLEGSVRRSGSRLRVSAELVDGLSGTHLWTRNFEGTADDLFDFQDGIVEAVLVVLEPEIRRAEIERSRRDRPGSLAAYDLYLRGLQRLNTNTVQDNHAALRLFSDAMHLEPENGLYVMYTAWADLIQRAMGWPGSSPDASRIVDLSHRAVEAAPRDGDVLGRAALALMHGSREYDLAEVLINRALETNPNSFWVLHCAGVWHLHCGDLEEAIRYFRRVSELSPNDPGTSHTMTGVAHAYLALRRYEEALDWADRSLMVNRSWSATYWILIAANAHLGRLGPAKRYLEQFNKLAPGTTIARIRAGQPDKIPDRIEHILAGMRIAGLATE